ncbi:TonB-dependent receptor plug domain-containing protein [Pelagicoccus albus]|uniref:TonB-dependent receptor plug domain-containing protein n=1 Tax=Pelagicoccus albus TaxID=415222 RepID=A0A7X1B3J3_9BACT|nr:TonB-dependent receptor plug domain-containing protein [Pelagicoccus albus]MBC2605005.1 TonB-dependent receptor plug domain-containing protein [Pelagicoccus albus]
MKQTNKNPIPRFRHALALSLLLGACSVGYAQESDLDLEDEEVFELSPFEVNSSNDTGYYAENTLAGSRLNTKVADLGASISVITMQQLDDTASTDINDVFRYEANTEGSATYTPSVQAMRGDGVVDVNAGFTAGNNGAPLTNNTANRIRGLGTPSTATNNYESNPNVPFDSYNVQSIEISRGPNSLLFGMGSPAGVVNSNTASAVIGAATNKVQVRFDDRGSHRASYSFNRTLVEDKLAVFGAILVDKKNFERKPSFDTTERAYGAITYEPFEKTRLRLTLEKFSNEHSRPNTLTPRDAVTPWIEGGSWGYNPATGMLTNAAGDTVGPIAQRSSSPRMDETRAYIATLDGYDASLWNDDQTTYNGVAIYGWNALSNVDSIMYTPGIEFGNSSRPKMQIANGDLFSYNYYYGGAYRTGFNIDPTVREPLVVTSEEIYADPVRSAAFDTAYTQSRLNPSYNQLESGALIGSYKWPGVTDTSVYDYTSTNILSMNFGKGDAKTYNLEFEQEILPDLNFNAGYFRQDYDSTTNYTVSQLNVATIYVDTNTHYPDGTVNPYYGKTYVYDFDPDQFVNNSRNESTRAMLAYTPDFTKNDNWTKWFGSHQLVGNLTTNKVTSQFIRKRWFVQDSEEGNESGVQMFTANPNPYLDGTPTGYSGTNRSVHRLYYLADPSDPNATVTQGSGAWYAEGYTGDMSYFNYSSNSWEGLEYTTGWVDTPWGTGSTQRQIDSESVALTSRLWEDRIIATFGYRTDDYKARSTTTAALQNEALETIADGMTPQEMWVDGVLQTDTILNRYSRWDSLSGNTKTVGGVIRPFSNWDNIDNEFLSTLGFSYNKSDNFNPPSSPAVDAFGTPLPKPTGEGEDYSVQFSLFEGKLFARVNWFESSNDNERTSPGASISRLTNNVDTTLFRNWARTIALINIGEDPTGENFGSDLSVAQEEALEDDIAAIWQLPYDYYADIGSIGATRSAVAEGMELSITYNPTKNWTIKMTAGEQETVYSGVLKQFDEWYDVRNPVWQSANAADYLLPQYQDLAQYYTFGGRRVDLTNFWSATGFNSNVSDDNQWGLVTVEDYYNNVVAPQYAIYSELEGQAAPGQRKYRSSLVTNYNFTDGRFKNFSVGGSVRWEDKAIIGYYGRPTPGSGSDDLTLSDISRPIYDDANTYSDIWFGYKKALNDNMNLKVQLNIVNAFEDGHLQVVGVNYDGSPNAYRIVDPRQFILTTTLDF